MGQWVILIFKQPPWIIVLSFKYNQWIGLTRIFSQTKIELQGFLCYPHPKGTNNSIGTVVRDLMHTLYNVKGTGSFIYLFTYSHWAKSLNKERMMNTICFYLSLSVNHSILVPNIGFHHITKYDSTAVFKLYLQMERFTQFRLNELKHLSFSHLSLDPVKLES